MTVYDDEMHDHLSRIARQFDADLGTVVSVYFDKVDRWLERERGRSYDVSLWRAYSEVMAVMDRHAQMQDNSYYKLQYTVYHTKKQGFK